jgi:ribosomal protein S18 acetylase RimI-like enzyme
MAQLRPMADDEYEHYLDVLRNAYVEDMVASGFMNTRDAEVKVEADIKAHLPEGLRTPAAYLYAVEEERELVGYAWMSSQRDQAGTPLAFVFDIWVRPEARGRGLGRAAMLALEAEARSLGLDRIRLNVFGHNKIARNLYRSLGYEELSVLMGKALHDRSA